ncbi:response regulator [Chromobacterium sp. IIBBL 290-4]|uniref:response regulator n=1 Tax=Chromobacterium sp. IIBBL 290-4 TaxID=2953890 RepID=UPI0020B8CE3D|nr:response regulator [Chromobacterium sp. IIBBL 290-4]UTH74320.1 response regulator [Chromobacterium sp. IIBBL 290-4]
MQQSTALVVDDNVINRRVATLFLAKQGWRVDQAESGQEALELLERQTYDCVLLDISMPGMSGLEVCQKIRANPQWRHLKVVAYTAHALADECEKIMKSGFDAIIVKPVTADRLRETVGEARAVDG